MPKLMEGYVFMLTLISVLFMTMVLHAILQDLEHLSQIVYTWKKREQQAQVFSGFGLEQLGLGKFDYRWEYLGEYPCVQLCQPRCQGTSHWRLILRYGHVKMHLRILKPVLDLTCKGLKPIYFHQPVIWRRKI